MVQTNEKPRITTVATDQPNPSGSLVPVTESKYGSMEVFSEMATASQWLPWLALFGGNSKAVKQGLVPIAHYALALGGDSYIDLGSEVDVLPLSWRPKATSFEGETPVSFFNPKSEEFLAVQKKSESPNSNCVFGPEFLLWVPSVRRFATFLMG